MFYDKTEKIFHFIFGYVLISCMFGLSIKQLKFYYTFVKRK